MEVAALELKRAAADLEGRIAAAPWRPQLNAFNGKLLGAVLKTQHFEVFALAAQQYPVLQPLMELAERVAKDQLLPRVDQRLDSLVAQWFVRRGTQGSPSTFAEFLLQRVPHEHRRVDPVAATACAEQTVRTEAELEAAEGLLEQQVAAAESKVRVENSQRRVAVRARWKRFVSRAQTVDLVVRRAGSCGHAAAHRRGRITSEPSKPSSRMVSAYHPSRSAPLSKALVPESRATLLRRARAHRDRRER